jgi:hypothetical protein
MTTRQMPDSGAKAASDKPPTRSLARRFGRAVVNLPGAGLVFVPQRAAGFAVGTWLRHRMTDPADPALVPGTDPPAARPSVGLAAMVALDEAILAVMKSPRRYPADADYATVRRELHEARDLYRARGFIERPWTYHRAPGPIEVEGRARSSYGLGYELISWPSGYEPHPDEPGRERWLGYAPNRTAHAMVLRSEPDRPWLVCVHGFGTGMAVADFFAFRARHLQQELGLNVVLPILPLHGPRRVSRMGGTELMSFQLQNYVLGMAQAVHDVRALIGWARGQGAERIGVHGMSLGAYVGALLSTLEPGLDLVIAGAPLCDVPKLFAHHSTPTLRKRIDPEGLLGDVAQEVHTVISPLMRPSLVPFEGRFIYAGLGDRMSTPAQAQRLWEHWERPRIAWYEGSHVTFLWSETVNRLLSEALHGSGFVTGRTPRRAPRAATVAARRAPGPRPGRS